MTAGQPEGRMPVSVRSNGVPMPAEVLAPMTETRLQAASTDDLRDQFGRDGYLLLRQFLTRERVLSTGRAYLDELDAAGAAATSIPYGTRGHPAYGFVRSATFDRLTKSASLRRLADTVLGGSSELLPRRILRHFPSGRLGASRAHVDIDYLDRGSDRVVTMWIPLLDCPLATGGLIYLDGSHHCERSDLDQLRRFTDRPEDHRPISNDLELTARQLGRRWLWTDYLAGDVVIHSPHLIHASLDNVSDADRLSIDVRFRRSDGLPDERWQTDWAADDGN